MKVKSFNNFFLIKESSEKKEDLESFDWRSKEPAHSSILDDVELVMSLLGLNCRIKEVKQDEDSGLFWTLLTDEGNLIELKRRSEEDLLKSLKIYKKEADPYPCIHIEEPEKKCCFRLADDLEIEEPIGFLDLTKKDPYYNFLKKKSLDRQNSQDEEIMKDYYLNFLKNNTGKDSTDPESDDSETERRDFLKKLKKVLSTFVEDPDNL
jgi:hypothetical protein